MSRLPVIVGFGGINSAGRSSFHHGYRRLVIDRLNTADTFDVFCGLATMMRYVTGKDGTFFDTDNTECPPEKIIKRFGKEILFNTLLRKVSPDVCDLDHVFWNKKVIAQSVGDSAIQMQMRRKMLPSQIPPNWEVQEIAGDSSKVVVTINGDLECMIEDQRNSLVHSGGQIPSGFDVGGLYKSNHHPRGLQLTVFGASDAIHSLGID